MVPVYVMSSLMHIISWCAMTFQFNYFNQSHIWNSYCVDLSVKVFSVMKSQFKKQSVELFILWTLLKYLSDPKFMFAFDFISSSVESSITKKKTLAKIACFLLFAASLKANYEELHFSKDSRDFFLLTVRYRGQEAGTVIVFCLRHYRPYRRYHYGYMGTRLLKCK